MYILLKTHSKIWIIVDYYVCYTCMWWKKRERKKKLSPQQNGVVFLSGQGRHHCGLLSHEVLATGVILALIPHVSVDMRGWSYSPLKSKRQASHWQDNANVVWLLSSSAHTHNVKCKFSAGSPWSSHSGAFPSCFPVIWAALSPPKNSLFNPIFKSLYDSDVHSTIRLTGVQKLQFLWAEFDLWAGPGCVLLLQPHFPSSRCACRQAGCSLHHLDCVQLCQCIPLGRHRCFQALSSCQTDALPHTLYYSHVWAHAETLLLNVSQRALVTGYIWTLVQTK